MNESISYLKSCASKLLAHASDVERARVTCNGICMSAYGERTTANSIPFPQDGSERPQSFCFRRSSGSGRWGRRSGAHSAQARVRRVLLLVSYSQKWRNAKNGRFSLLWHSVACSRQQEDTYRQVGSARASHLAFIPIASQPRRSCLTSLSSCHCPVLCVRQTCHVSNLFLNQKVHL